MHFIFSGFSKMSSTLLNVIKINIENDCSFDNCEEKGHKIDLNIICWAMVKYMGAIKVFLNHAVMFFFSNRYFKHRALRHTGFQL